MCINIDIKQQYLTGRSFNIFIIMAKSKGKDDCRNGYKDESIFEEMKVIGVVTYG